MSKKIRKKSPSEKLNEARAIKLQAKRIKKEIEEMVKKKVTRDEPENVYDSRDAIDEKKSKYPSFSLKHMLRRRLQEIEPQNQKTYAELLINKMIKRAIIDDDGPLIRLIWNYLEGMPKQTVDSNVEMKTALVRFVGGSVSKGSVQQVSQKDQEPSLLPPQTQTQQQDDGVDDNEVKQIEARNDHNNNEEKQKEQE